MQVKQRVVAIVVTYNRKELLIECIEALKAQSVDNLDIMIVDNASTDGTFEQLQGYIEWKEIIYYNTGKNIGGAGGFNYGIKAAYNNGYDMFWLMDDDTIPEATALEKLLHKANELNYQFGYLSSKVLWTDGTLCRMNIPTLVDDQKEFTSESQECFSISRTTFVSFLVMRSIVRQVGLPIKEFFIWADDTNYCYRINRIAPGFCVSSSVVIHKMKNNRSVDIVEDDERLDRYERVYRNRYYNFRYQHDLIRYYYFLIHTIRDILFHSNNHKIIRITYMLKGTVQGWFFRPEIEYCVIQ